MTRAEGFSVLTLIHGDLGALPWVLPAVPAGRPARPGHAKRFSVSAAVWPLGWL